MQHEPPIPPRPPSVPPSAGRDETILGSRDASRSRTTGPTPAVVSGPAKRCPTCGERFPFDYRVCPRDITELELDVDEKRDPYLGTTLAQTYRIVRRIGIGGMGTVYEASHTRLPGRRFAIKLMHGELARKADLATRFRREAEVAGLAAHPNVIDVFDVDETPDGTPFIVTELLEGEDLGQRLDREGRLPLDETVSIVRQLCAAIAAAHAVGVIHRDLKPDNVFLVGDVQPRVKLLDFGIARLNDTGATSRTRTGVVMGTPSYMAPEQARGERVDHRCDVYAVGAIVYRCLVGRPVFDDEDPAATLTAVLTSEPERPRAVRPDLPEAVEIVIERAIAREPDERFQNMSELDAALASLVGQTATSLLPTRPYETTAEPVLLRGDANLEAARTVKRARPTIVAISLLGLVLVVGLVSDLLARLIAYNSAEKILTEVEARLVVLGAVATLATPAGLWVRAITLRVWGNSLRAVALARHSTTVVAATASTYAIVLLGARILDLVFSEPPSTTSGLLAAILACAAAVIAGTVALLGPRVRRHFGPAAPNG